MKTLLAGVAAGVVLQERTGIGVVVALALPAVPWVIVGAMHVGEWFNALMWPDLRELDEAVPK